MPNQDPTQPQNPSVNPPPPQGVPPVPPPQPNEPPAFPLHTDGPPIPPAFMDVDSSQAGTPEKKPEDKPTGVAGSAAPPNIPPTVSRPPKKKFGTGKIIATILGLFVMVGGVSAGIFLTQQNQNVQEKAAGACGARNTGCLYYDCSQKVDCSTGRIVSGFCDTEYNSTSDPCHRNDTPVGDNISCIGFGYACSAGGAPCCEGLYCTDYGRCALPADVPSTSGTNTTSGITTCDNSCPSSDCHCQGGDACTSVLCEPGVHNSCINQGRSWCRNMLYNSGPFRGYTCCEVGYTCNPGGPGCVPGEPTSPPDSPPSSPPTNPPTTSPTASCSSVKVYDSQWNQLNTTQLSALTPGTTIRVSVIGSPAAEIDKARFTINGTLRAEVTTKKSGTDEFYDEYQIPEGVTTFTIAGEVHHTTLGWY